MPGRGAAGQRNFEPRYGLASKPSQVRFRILDGRLAIQGLTDLAVPAREFASLDLPVERVFITENEINGLAFPGVPGSLVIFGLGYGLDRLSEVRWLHRSRACTTGATSILTASISWTACGCDSRPPNRF